MILFIDNRTCVRYNCINRYLSSCCLEADKMKEPMEIKKNESEHMTNEEYRKKLNYIFENINENYKLRWFYKFILEKIEGSI